LNIVKLNKYKQIFLSSVLVRRLSLSDTQK